MNFSETAEQKIFELVESVGGMKKQMEGIENSLKELKQEKKEECRTSRDTFWKLTAILLSIGAFCFEALPKFLLLLKKVV